MPANYQFLEIQHRSPDYVSALEFRDRILRAPLGLGFSEEQVEAESTETHLIAKSDTGEVVASACIVWTDATTAKFRQIAVAEEEQGQGLGKQMVEFVESTIWHSGRTLIFCHARQTVSEFYRRLGYEVHGDLFEEIGIPHVRMEKRLKVGRD